MINSARKILIFSIIIFGLSSCQSVLMKIYGIKNPEIENKKTILKTANKYKLDTSNIVTVNGKEFPYFLNGRSIPNGSVYDKNGRYIEYRKSDTSCNAGLFQFIESLNLKDKYHQPDSADLNTVLKKFRDLSGSNLKTLENADFYLLIYWTIWSGKLNKDHVKKWEELASQNKNCKIKIIKVNLDVQEYWEQSDRDKMIKAMNK